MATSQEEWIEIAKSALASFEQESNYEKTMIKLTKELARDIRGFDPISSKMLKERLKLREKQNAMYKKFVTHIKKVTKKASS